MANILDLITVDKKDLGKSDKTSGNKYEIVMAYMGAQILFYFHDNYMNKADKKDFLYALINDSQAYSSCRDIDDFASEFGYEKVSECIRAYNGCKEQYEKYNKLFNSKEQEELENLLADY